MRNPTSSNRSSVDDREPEAGEDRRAPPRRGADDVDDGDREIGVAHRPNPLPLREADEAEDEEELSEADILEEHDLRDLDEDDLARAEGPAA